MMVGAGGAYDGGFGGAAAEALDGGDELPRGGGAQAFAQDFAR